MQSSESDLRSLAMSRPTAAETLANRLLSGRPTPEARADAFQALGIVARERGEISRAIRLFRAGVRAADAAGQVDRRADLLASLGHSLALAGRRAPALTCFDQALAGLRGIESAQVLVRRSVARVAFGDDEAAYADARAAARIFHRAGDLVWEARARNNVGGILVTLGRFGEADLQYRKAQALAE